MPQFPGLLISVLVVIAAPPSAEVSFGEIDQVYKNSRSIEQLLHTEKLILDSMKTSDPSGDWTWRLARTYYGLGKLSNGEERGKYFIQCVEQTQRTLKINPESANAYFFKGLCMGKRGEIQGIWESLVLIKPIKKNMESAIRLDPSVNDGGPYRFLGRLYYELPLFLGGSLDKSIEYLEKAVHYGPKFGKNYLYLAQAYFENGDYQPARETLLSLLNVTRSTQADLEVHRIRSQARELLKQIENF